MKNANKCLITSLIIIFTNATCKCQQLYGYSDDNITICINEKENKVSGFLTANLYIDDIPKKGIYQSCNIFFSGSFLNLNSSVKIKAYYSLDSSHFTLGEINIDKKSGTCKITLEEPVISCMNIFDLKFGETFNLANPLPIKECRRIKAEKAYFWKEGKREKIYIIKGDFVAIIQEKNNNLIKILYKNKDLKTIEGWIKKSDLE